MTNDSHIDLQSIMPGMINHRSTKDIVNGRLFSLMIAGRYDLHSYFLAYITHSLAGLTIMGVSIS